MNDILRPFWPAITTLLCSLALHLAAALADSPAVRTAWANGPRRAWRRRFGTPPHAIFRHALSAVLIVFVFLALGMAFVLIGRPGGGLSSEQLLPGIVPGTALQWLTLILASLLLITQLGSTRAIGAAAWADSAWILSITAGLLTLCAADSLLLILTGQSLLSCSLIGLLRAQRGRHRDVRPQSGSTADSLRIGLFRIALGAAVTVYGLAMLYAGSGRVHLSELHQQITQHVLAGQPMPLLDLGSVLLVCGLALQAGIPPFHFGCEESLSGLSWWSSACIGLSAGLASLIVLVQIAAYACRGQPVLQIALITLSTTALTVGNLRMLRTAQLERVFSSLVMISIGSALAPLALANWSLQPDALAPTFGLSRPGGNPVAVLWLTTQFLSLAGLTAVLASLDNLSTGVRFEEDLRGLVVQRPVAGICASVCLISLAGLPPCAGFWSRWMLILSVQSVQFEEPLALAFVLILGLNLALTAMHCLRLVSLILGTRPLRYARRLERPAALIAGLGVAALLLSWGWSPGPLLTAIWSGQAAVSDAGIPDRSANP